MPADRETIEKLEDMDEKLDKIYASSEKTRKYFLWTMIISIVVLMLPLIGLLFIIPSALSLYGDIGGSGGDVNKTLDSLGL